MTAFARLCLNDISLSTQLWLTVDVDVVNISSVLVCKSCQNQLAGPEICRLDPTLCVVSQGTILCCTSCQIAGPQVVARPHTVAFFCVLGHQFV